MTPFLPSSFQLNENTTLHVINIEQLNNNIEKLIDEYIISICTAAGRDITLITQKRKLREFIQKKTDSNLEIGCISEFFIHLYLNSIWFRQECLYSNLEENSIKKWFDGYYSLNDEEWIMESKSGNISTKGISHKKKIHEAFDDLSKKIAGKVENNPRENARNHAKIAWSKDTILKSINELSVEFTNGIYHDIKNFNIIPSSTIFLDWQIDDTTPVSNNEAIKTEITAWPESKEYKKMHIVCITQNTKNIFLEYLNK